MQKSKIILDLAVTLDGYISGPNEEIDWLVKDESTSFGDILTEILTGIDAIFYGRVSYDLWGNYKPEGSNDAKLNEAYELLHSKKKFVFSKTRTNNSKDVVYINSNIKENVEKIRQELKGNIWLYGGGKIITTFINLGLVDVFRLAIHPVIIGEGIPLFSDIKTNINLSLTDVRRANSGVLLVTYSSEGNSQPV